MLLTETHTHSQNFLKKKTASTKVLSPAWIRLCLFVWRGMGTRRRENKASQDYSVKKTITVYKEVQKHLISRE